MPAKIRLWLKTNRMLAFLGLGATLLVGWGLQATTVLATSQEEHQNTSSKAESSSGISVEVITPKPGGLIRECVQPGTVQPFEYADLYAKVSGFLDKLTVDIGSHVKKGDLLAHISVPEDEKQVDRDSAALEHAQAQVQQMKAHLVAAEAEARAARGMVDKLPLIC